MSLPWSWSRTPISWRPFARRKGDRLVVGFALETGDGLRARETGKLQRKGVDFIVLNDASVLGSERTSVTVIGREGVVLELRDRPKRAVADALVRLVDR